MKDMMRREDHNCGQRRISRFLRRIAIWDTAGQSLVELALVMPIFSALLLGAVEFGRLAYAQIEVSSAARAGVAYGAQSVATASDIAGMEAAATNDGSDVAGLSANATRFCSCSDAPATQVDCAAAPATCSGLRVLNYVQVTTTAGVTPLVNYPGLPNPFTLSGAAVMRVAQ